MTAWFVVGTVFSLAVGSPAHALFDVAIGVPLIAARPHLRG